MMFVTLKTFSSELLPTNSLIFSESNPSCKQLKAQIVSLTGIPLEHFKLYQDKKYLDDECLIQHGKTVHMLLELRGGKGGFGSMLRAIGAQIEKTTNKEACRDLSGRRLRDINEEKRLKKWIAKQAERERERAERKQRRMERLRALPPHEFHDPTYDKICLSLTENVSDAVNQGLENMKKNEGTLKRKATSTVSSAPKKLQLWNDEEFETSDTDNDNASSSEISKDSTDENSSQSSSLEHTNSLENSSSNQSETADVSSSKNKSKVSAETSEVTGENSSTKEDSDNKNMEVDSGTYESVEELEALGLETLKTVLTSLGMKCGGTLKERAERLFAVQGLKKEEIEEKYPSFVIKSQKT